MRVFDVTHETITNPGVKTQSKSRVLLNNTLRLTPPGKVTSKNGEIKKIPQGKYRIPIPPTSTGKIKRATY